MSPTQFALYLSIPDLSNEHPSMVHIKAAPTWSQTNYIHPRGKKIESKRRAQRRLVHTFAANPRTSSPPQTLITRPYYLTVRANSKSSSVAPFANEDCPRAGPTEPVEILPETSKRNADRKIENSSACSPPPNIPASSLLPLAEDSDRMDVDSCTDPLWVLVPVFSFSYSESGTGQTMRAPTFTAFPSTAFTGPYPTFPAASFSQEFCSLRSQNLGCFQLTQFLRFSILVNKVEEPLSHPVYRHLKRRSRPLRLRPSRPQTKKRVPPRPLAKNSTSTFSIEDTMPTRVTVIGVFAPQAQNMAKPWPSKSLSFTPAQFIGLDLLHICELRNKTIRDSRWAPAGTDTVLQRTVDTANTEGSRDGGATSPGSPMIEDMVPAPVPACIIRTPNHTSSTDVLKSVPLWAQKITKPQISNSLVLTPA